MLSSPILNSTVDFASAAEPQPVEIPQKGWFEEHRSSFVVVLKDKDGPVQSFTYHTFVDAKTFDRVSLINWRGLLANLPDFWQKLEAYHAGRTTPVPRLSALCDPGPVGQEIQIKGVTYSSVQPPVLIAELWTKISAKLGWQRPIGQIVALRFTEPSHSVGYHNWQPEEMDSDLPAVCYLWLGASRPILWRHAANKITKKITLDDGFLFVAQRDTWDGWQFQVPKSKLVKGESILLIFK